MEERLDFSKYVGTYSVSEAKEVLKNMENDLLEAEKREAIRLVKEIHGDNFTYEVRKGTSVDLTKLKANQRVCASGLKGHHVLLTEK